MQPQSTTKEIPLSQGYVAIVDEADYARVSPHKWSASVMGNQVYAVRGTSKKFPPRRTILLHRFLLDAPVGVLVDHRDGNGLNCQRSNLRLCSKSENMRNRKHPKQNTSGYKGVCWDKRRQKWMARIVVDQRGKHIGRYDSLIEAARAYDEAANKFHGEFALLNFPDK